jgi:hypothetical protein
MAATTFETKFLIGAKFTGATAFYQVGRAVGKTENQVKKLGRTVTAVNTKMKGLGMAVAGGVFGAIGAAALIGRAIAGVKQIGNAAWDAASAVQTTKEEASALLKTYGATSEEADKMTESFYKAAQAAEATGQDAEIMLGVMSKLRGVMPADMILKNLSAFEDLVTVFSGPGGPTDESAANAAAAYDLAVRKARGPLLDKLKMTKEDMKIFRNMEVRQRRAFLNEKIRQKFAGAIRAS